MKHIRNVKKVVSFMLALVMSLAMTITVFAQKEEGYTITVNQSDAGHTYEVYQIFAGDLYEGILANIVWGSGVSTEGQNALGDAAVQAESLKTAEDAAAFAKEVAEYLSSPAGSSSTLTDGKYIISGLNPGYYLIKDQEESLAGEDDSYTSYILKVVEDTAVNPKADKPTSQKKVDDKNDSNTTEEETAWQDSADYDIGDEVPFQLKAVLPGNYDEYQVYQLIFHDEESAGLTFQADSVKVYVDDTLIESGYEVVTTQLEDDCTFEVRFADLKKMQAVKTKSVITVEYTSVLNENAVIGSAGNPNTMYMEYSNNPNDESGSETGKTPEDTVIVFTYRTLIHKMTENPDYDAAVEGSEQYIPLTGAEFKLEKKLADDTYKEIAVVKNEEGTVFTFAGIDDGEYRLTETKTPDGYNSIEPILFTVTAEHDILSDYPALKALSGDVTTGEITFTENLSEGSLSTDIQNKAGVILPSTGGAGTVLFYVLGGSLILTAVAVLIIKKHTDRKV